ncbi:hypothetical protein Tco_1185891 [Tanacetum coccineum]
MTSRPRTRVFHPGPVWGYDRLVSRAKVMAALVISISSDTSEESVGSHALQVILFGAIPAIIPAIPEVLIVPIDPIVSPEDSLPPVPDLPLVLPFLCSDDSEADDESEPAEQRPERHKSLTVYDGKAIPFSRPYQTHPNGPRKLLTARKRVRPLPARRLARRRVPHHLSDHHSSPESSSSSSSLDPSSVHSSACDSSGQAHSGPSTRDVPSRVAPLSTPYPPATSESSLSSSSERLLDSSSPSSKPSRKRCRSPTALVPSSTHVLRPISLTPTDLLPPRKSDGVSASTEDGLDMGVKVMASDIREDEEEFDAEASEADTREIAVDPLATGNISESTGGDVPDHGTSDEVVDITYEILGDLFQRFHDHAEEIPVHWIQVIESVQRFQGHGIARVDLGVTTMTERLSAL